MQDCNWIAWKQNIKVSSIIALLLSSHISPQSPIGFLQRFTFPIGLWFACFSITLYDRNKSAMTSSVNVVFYLLSDHFYGDPVWFYCHCFDWELVRIKVSFLATVSCPLMLQEQTVWEDALLFKWCNICTKPRCFAKCPLFTAQSCSPLFNAFINKGFYWQNM